MTRLKKVILLEFIILILTISINAQKDTNTVEVYFKTSYIKQDSLSESIARGKEVYADFCMQCHLADGKGTPNTIPPLANSDWLTQKRKESIYAIKYGLKGSIKVNGKTYNNAMSSLGLEDEEIADVMNYIMNTWGNTQTKMVTLKEVAEIKK